MTGEYFRDSLTWEETELGSNWGAVRPGKFDVSKKEKREAKKGRVMDRGLCR